MRLRVEVTTQAKELPWHAVLAPGRGLAYNLLNEVAPRLAQQLHGAGWGATRMVPFGHSSPVFPDAARRPGTYAVGGRGFFELGSPLPGVVEAWAQALRGHAILDWGGVALRITGVYRSDPPSFAERQARMRTETPVVIKSTPRSTTDDAGPGRRSWLLPTEPEFATMLSHNLRRKAETLGHVPDVHLDAITWVGPKRSFTVSRGKKPGAEVEVALTGEPRTLQAIWSWGLGQANAAGFGWIGAVR